ncbi:predicted protein [Histoplasma mississippiense (nom. inval.)]|uniref:predicted protein n=1 Tax=Ajellomyces capsulatus (strain NAm1 / WU24) TaxID=2059318 RepID=UPI000157CB1A|nr:predicted protein [Histoplasma mississippiense (nom. inval.)]EDN09153.1 predicted protein [Histoplasma mississippiense (nom. inval.)]
MEDGRSRLIDYTFEILGGCETLADNSNKRKDIYWDGENKLVHSKIAGITR